MSKSERLKAARIRAGFRTAADAARHLRIPYGTYSGHESGTRGIKDSELTAYADTFGVSAAWLAYDDEKASNESNRHSLAGIAGTVGVGIDGLVSWFEAPRITGKLKIPGGPALSADGLEIREFPIPDFNTAGPKLSIYGANLSSILVTSGAIKHIARQGDMIYFDRNIQSDELRFAGVPALCLCDDQKWYVAVPFAVKGGNSLVLRHPSKSSTPQRAVLSVFPIMAIVTQFGRSTALRQFAAVLSQAAGYPTAS